MGAFTTVTAKGQITIPKDVRDELNITPGTKIYISSFEGEMKTIVKNKSITDLAGILGKPPAGAGATLEDFDRAIGEALGQDDERIKREWNEGRKPLK